MILHCDTTRFIWEVLENNEYSFLYDKLRVLDLGCNIGTFSLWIYPHIDKLWAVDSEQEHIDNFSKTIKDNDLRSITIFTERVLDLKEFMGGHNITNIDVLKIDIEGDEYKIFERADFPSDEIKTIIGEYHQNSPEQLLIDKGYRYFEVPNKHFLARKT